MFLEAIIRKQSNSEGEVEGTVCVCVCMRVCVPGGF